MAKQAKKTEKRAARSGAAKPRAAKNARAKLLAEYDAKRDFTKSPEPAARVAKTSAGRSFCVQKHLASHLHYDFRLEHNGVLLSWAVPKGPSLNPADKRMAVHVEDHPVDYGGFEGVIPSGYGAGVVLLWDRGTWSPEPGFEDVDAAIKKGELKFTLDGVKLKGSWVLVRTRMPASAGREGWLLIKHRDRWSGEIDIAAEAPQSVKSFGDFADITAANDEVTEWRTTPPVKGGDAGTLLKEVLAKAKAIRSGDVEGVEMKKSVWESHKPGKVKAAATKASSNRKKTNHERGAHATENTSPPKLTNQDKVLFPKAKFTKGDLVNYYRRIAPLILPHLAGRAITLKRYPDGVEGEPFFEKRCNQYRPGWLNTLSVPTGTGKTIDYCELNSEHTLMWAANLAAIEIHVPLALADDYLTPTAMVFDLDPGAPATMKDCMPIARRLKSMFDDLKLKCAVKSSGGKGLHLLVPLNTSGVTFDDTKAFARAVALTLEKDDPKRVISDMSRAQRAGKIFIDWSQNDRNKTTVGVYSVRARELPTVSWPIDWSDLEGRSPPKPVRADKLDDAPATGKAFEKLMQTKQKLPNVAATK